MASENIGSLYPTKIPGYEDAADIQAALKLYHYGSTTYDITNTDPENLLSDSVAGHIQSVVDRVEVIESKGLGSDFLSSLPTGVDDGFIWMDATSNATGSANYASAIYSPVQPTVDLTEGLLWVDTSKTPPVAKVYNGTSFDALTEIPNIIDAAGDLIVGSGSDDISKLSIGSNGQVLTVVSGLPSWQNPNGSWSESYNAELSGSSISVTGLTGKKYYIILDSWSHSDTTQNKSIAIQFNSDSSLNYLDPSGHTPISFLSTVPVNNSGTYTYGILIDLADTLIPLKPVSSISHGASETEYGYYANASAITSIQFTLSSGTFDAGSLKVWSYS